MKKTPAPFAGEDDKINVIVETAKGSRNKYSYDDILGILKLKNILPSGMVFPFDFGSIPSTQAQDGDPLDVLVLMEDPVDPPCLVEAHLIGVIEAKQTEDGKTSRNDRLIAISKNGNRPSEVESLNKLDKKTVKEIEHFFESYNELDGKHFKVLDYKGPKAAARIVKKAHKKYEENSSPD